ncbi:MAG TPA: SPOR domain-containing protein [Bacteroidales bacterium]|nr:SPOR domain-containing protein [Bacteroidales bacterium]HOE05868.1 SPOR domain-containing protein [Bacteroidales bacterium]
MNIEKYIPGLLCEHDCVIVPGFGGFVVNYREAMVDFQHQKLTPPARVAAFNQSLTMNDGLLVSYVSQQEQVSYSIAMEEVKSFVLSVRSELKSSGRASIEQLGYFTLQGESLEFHPLADQNFLRDAYGLTEFHYPLLKTVSTQQVVEETAKELVRQVAQVKHRRPGWGITIPVAAASIALAVVLFNQDKMLQSISHNYEMNPFQIPASKSIVHNNRTAVSIEEPVITPVNSDSITKTQTTVQPSTQVVETNNGNRVHIVAGCFSNRENAEAMLAKLSQQGYQACILESADQMHRVSLKSYRDSDAANAELQQLKTSTGNQALWVMVE